MWPFTVRCAERLLRWLVVARVLRLSHVAVPYTKVSEACFVQSIMHSLPPWSATVITHRPSSARESIADCLPPASSRHRSGRARAYVPMRCGCSELPERTMTSRRSLIKSLHTLPQPVLLMQSHELASRGLRSS